MEGIPMSLPYIYKLSYNFWNIIGLALGLQTQHILVLDLQGCQMSGQRTICMTNIMATNHNHNPDHTNLTLTLTL